MDLIKIEFVAHDESICNRYMIYHLAKKQRDKTGEIVEYVLEMEEIYDETSALSREVPDKIKTTEMKEWLTRLCEYSSFILVTYEFRDANKNTELPSIAEANKELMLHRVISAIANRPAYDDESEMLARIVEDHLVD